MALRLTTADADAYLELVEKTVGADSYRNFLDVMKDLKDNRIEAPAAVKKVEDLFEGHGDLIEGFNAFLPEGLQICSPEVKMLRESSEFAEALQFVGKVKAAFPDGVVYKRFLAILTEHRQKIFAGSSDDVHKVSEEVKALFSGHPDLIQGFEKFLPWNSNKSVEHLRKMFGRL